MAGQRHTSEDGARFQVAMDGLTRRDVLKRGGATALALGASSTLLAACGGDDDDTSTTAGKVGGTLDFLSWEGYDFPDKNVPAMKAWRAAHDVTMHSTYIATNEDIPAKLKGGGGGFDISSYGHPFKSFWVDQLQLFIPLDEAKLPNLKNLIPFFASDFGNLWLDSDGTRTGVPMAWGSMGLNYDSAMVAAPTSYDVLFEPKYKNKVTVVDDPQVWFQLAAGIHGYEPSQLTQAQFEQVSDWLARLISQTKGTAPSYGDAATRLVAGDVIFAWPGWAAVNQFAALGGKKTIKTVLPKEGGVSFVDAFAIVQGADNVDTAYAFINETMVPRVAAQEANFLVGGTPVQGAIGLLEPEIKGLYDYSDIHGQFERAPLYNIPPVKSDQYVTYDEVLHRAQELKAES
jgi:spermidine/putrescine transport system substrate-binding protein